MSNTIRFSEIATVCAGAILTASVAAPAFADDPPPPAAAEAVEEGRLFNLSGVLTVDGVAPITGGSKQVVRELDKTDIVLGIDFEKLGWKGGTAQVTFENSSGGQPNADLGTLEGIDNNETSSHRGRIFEAWLQQAFGGRGSIKTGLIDLNSEFYVNGASGLLIAPQFGLGSELAATGPGGPSTFPQTGLAVRLLYTPTKNTYLLAGAFNADGGDPGDPGGVDTSFDDGVVEIAEAGWSADGKGKLAIGGWRYSHEMDDLFDTAGGAPVPRTSNGGYILAEKVMIDGGDKGASLTGFFRGGLSDGDTGPFNGSWQLGALINHPIASRPDSQISFAVDQAFLGDKYRAASAAAGLPLENSETHVEVTYADKLTKHVMIQPDLQYIANPGGDGSAKNQFVFLLRFIGSF